MTPRTLQYAMMQETGRQMMSHVRELEDDDEYAGPRLSNAELKATITRWDDPPLAPHKRRLGVALIGNSCSDGFRDLWNDKKPRILPEMQHTVPVLQLPRWFDEEVS
jgi:hypothetical protein